MKVLEATEYQLDVLTEDDAVDDDYVAYAQSSLSALGLTGEVAAGPNLAQF